MDPSIIIKTVEDIRTHIETSIENNVQKHNNVKKDMPTKLSFLVGALKLNLLVFESNVNIKKKNLPTNPFSRHFRINCLELLLEYQDRNKK